MKSNISFFNWSLEKLLKEETDSLVKAKYKILFVIFILFFIKGAVAIVTAIYFKQDFQLIRAIAFVAIYLLLFKTMLNKKLPFFTIAHIILISSLILVATNLFITAKSVNIVTIQFVFTLILSSFYILNSGYGFLYSVLGIAPVIFSLLSGYQFDPNSGLSSLASPGYELIVIFNFLTIIYIPYLFYEAFIKTLKEKEELNLQLQIAVNTANEAVRSKSEFLSTMSHELRTPLNTVIGTTDLLLTDVYEPHQEENLKDLKFSANCLLNIINDILDYNKLESAKLKLETIDVNLVTLLNKVCSGLHNQATDKNIGLKLDLDEGLNDIDVVTDPTRITQIIYNLAGNAIKFTEEGEVVVKLSIQRKTSTNISVRFSIKDTGIGISEEKQVLIFEPFNQASSSITRNFGGTGLGLSIVKRLLFLFDSEIKLESSAMQGSTFYFDVDFKYHTRFKFESDMENPKTQLPQDISDLKILVAEDNLMNRVLIKKVFSRWKNEPVFAENGQEAIEIATETKFDVILMDLHMPVMDGYLAAKTIKQGNNSMNWETPIIAFTASISDTILAEVKASGMVDFIYKPFNPKDMYDKLRDLYPPKLPETVF